MCNCAPPSAILYFSFILGREFLTHQLPPLPLIQAFIPFGGKSHRIPSTSIEFVLKLSHFLKKNELKKLAALICTAVFITSGSIAHHISTVKRIDFYIVFNLLLTFTHTSKLTAQEVHLRVRALENSCEDGTCEEWNLARENWGAGIDSPRESL